MMSSMHSKIRRVIFEGIRKYSQESGQQSELLVPQIKQIAGRAGRYQPSSSSSTASPSLPDIEAGAPEDAPGVVTAFDDESLEGIQAALATPPIPLLHAHIEPPFAKLTRLHNVCSDKTTWADLIALALLCSCTEPPYRLSSLSRFAELAPVISEIPKLTLGEYDLFSAAPAPRRSELGIAALKDFARAKVASEPVDVRAWATKRGIMASLKEPTSMDTLLKLEEAFRVLALYRWLSYRDPLIFRDGEEAAELMKEVNDALAENLAASRTERTQHRAQRRKARIVETRGRRKDAAKESFTAKEALRDQKRAEQLLWQQTRALKGKERKKVLQRSKSKHQRSMSKQKEAP